MLGTKICIITEALLNMQSYIYTLNKSEWTVITKHIGKLTTQRNRAKIIARPQIMEETKKRSINSQEYFEKFCIHKLEQGVAVKRNLIKSSGRLKIYKKLRKPILALEERKGEWKKKVNKHSKLTQGAIIPLLRVLRRETIENGRVQ